MLKVDTVLVPGKQVTVITWRWPTGVHSISAGKLLLERTWSKSGLFQLKQKTAAKCSFFVRQSLFLIQCHAVQPNVNGMGVKMLGRKST